MVTTSSRGQAFGSYGMFNEFGKSWRSGRRGGEGDCWIQHGTQSGNLTWWDKALIGQEWEGYLVLVGERVERFGRRIGF